MILRTNTLNAACGMALLVAFATTQLHAQTLSLSGADTTANGWRTINASGGGFVTDDFNDSQTGQTVPEIVGSSVSPAAYFGYGTISSTEYLGFRVRLEELSSNESNLKQVTWFGFNFDGDASVDLWVGMDHKSQQSNDWQVVIANATNQNNNVENIGPSNAGMVYSTGGQTTLPINSYAAVNGTNYSYVTASASNTTLGTAYDLDGAGAVDALLSWTVPYADFVAAVNSSAVMGTGFGFNQDTLFTVTVVTSNTQNTVNQDVGGVTGLSVIFVYSAPISAATPVPEPSTAVILAALFGPFVVRRRRRA